MLTGDPWSEAAWEAREAEEYKAMVTAALTEDPAATMQLLGHCPAMSEQAVSRDLSGVPDLDPFLSVLAHRLGGGHPIAALQTTSLTAASVLRQGTLHGSPLSGQKPLSCHDHGLLSCMRVLTGTSLLCLS